ASRRAREHAGLCPGTERRATGPPSVRAQCAHRAVTAATSSKALGWPMLPLGAGTGGPLLQQPGGFEGLGSLVELELAHAQAVAERIDVEGAGIELDSTAPTPTGVVDGDDDVVAGLEELLWSHLHLFPGGRPPLPHRLHLVPPVRRYLLDHFINHVR